MDKLEQFAYDFMNAPRNDKERLAEIKECDIIDAIKGLNGKGKSYLKQVNLDEVIKDVEWLIEQAEKVEKLEKEVEWLKVDSKKGYTILAEVRDILLPLVNPVGNACGDMLSCTVSNPECIECLAKQIRTQIEE